MKKKRNRKKWLVATGAFALLAIGAATFAWFQSNDKVTNHFEGDLAGNDVEIIEQFVPKKDWKPGDEVAKKVSVTNIGEYDSLIRVSLKETLAKLKNAEAKLSDDVTLLNGKKESEIYLMPLDLTKVATGYVDSKVVTKQMTVTGGDYAGTYTLKVKENVVENLDKSKTYNYVSYWDNGTKQYYAKTNGFDRAADGTLTPQTAQFKYVSLERDTPSETDWTTGPYAPTFTVNATGGTATIQSGVDTQIVLNFVNLSTDAKPGSWTYNQADGFFYYIGVVGTQAQTAQLLNSVKLLSTADNTYSKISYDLDVNAKSIQATKEAVNSTDWLANTNTVIKEALEGLL